MSQVGSGIRVVLLNDGPLHGQHARVPNGLTSGRFVSIGDNRNKAILMPVLESNSTTTHRYAGESDDWQYVL